MRKHGKYLWRLYGGANRRLAALLAALALLCAAVPLSGSALPGDAGVYTQSPDTEPVIFTGEVYTNEEDTTPVSEPEPEATPEQETEPALADCTLVHDRYPVTVRGLMPAGLSLIVRELSEAEAAAYLEAGVELVFAYDIMLLDPDGVEYQPDPDYPLTVTITPAAPVAAPVEVLHVSEDGATGETTIQVVADAAAPVGGAVAFEAEGFSIYIGTTPKTEVSYPAVIYYSNGFFYNSTTQNDTTRIVDESGTAISNMEALIRALGGNTTIYLQSQYNVSGTEDWSSDSDKEVKLYRGASGRMLTVPVNTVLNLELEINGNKESFSEVATTGIEVQGTMNIKSGAVVQNFSVSSNGGAIYVNNGTVVMSGGKICGNDAGATGGALLIRNGAFTMNGGEISGNTATGQGGGIRAEGSTVTISGGTFSGNAAADGADLSGCEYNNTDTTVYINGGSINVISGVTPKKDNTQTQDLRLFAITVAGHPNKSVQSISINDGVYSYNCTDVYTDSQSRLYIWLPEGSKVNTVAFTDSTVTITAPTPHVEIAFPSLKAGSMLTASMLDGTATNWEWKRGETTLSNSNTYTTTAADINQMLTVYGYTQDASYSASVTISTNTPTFTVTIPDNVQVNDTPTDFSISGTLYGLLTGQSVAVAVSSTNGWYMKCGEGDDAPKLAYTLKKQGGEALTNNTAATFDTNGTNSQSLVCSKTGSPIYSGVYTDTLTFTVSPNLCIT